MRGGEIFVPKIPSMRITDFAEAVAPGCKIEVVGVRPGEKLHEVLITEDESSRALDLGACYIVKPLFKNWIAPDWDEGKPLPKGFHYSSDSNQKWLEQKELAAITESLD